MDTRAAAPATVGDILREEFITPDMPTLYYLAASIEMDVDQFAQTLSNEHQLSDAEADRLGEYLGTGGEFWKNLRDGHLRWKIAPILSAESVPWSAARFSAKQCETVRISATVFRFNAI